jgi:uncharacterized membrane protein
MSLPFARAAARSVRETSVARFNLVRIFSARPRLVEAVLFGGLVALGSLLVPGGVSPSTRFIVSWDAGCLFFIVTMLWVLGRQKPEDMQRRAAQQDEGQGFILTLVLVAAVTSIGAVAVELSAAKNLHGLDKSLRIALAFATVAISWFLVQLIFAIHYAHKYHSPDVDDKVPGPIVKGLHFPGDEPPDFWDFLHFAVVIGVASQTADIEFTSKTLRRIGTVHGVIAFTFNTVILALGINLMAGLF